MKKILQGMIDIEANTHMSLAEAEYSRSLGIESRGEKENSFQKAISHLEATIGYLGLDEDKKLMREISHLFWDISETLTQEFWFACHEPMEKHLPGAANIGLISTLYGLVERGKDLKKMDDMMISTFEKALVAGFGNGDPYYIYGKDCLGTDEEPDIEVFRRFNKRLTDWIEESENKIKRIVESHFINPDGVELKVAYENLIRERVLKHQKDASNVTRVEVKVDLENNFYNYTIYCGEIGHGAGGDIRGYWKNLLNMEKIGKVLSLSSGEVSDKFANLAGGYDIMQRLN